MNKKKVIALLCASVLTTNVYPNIPVLAAETIQSETQQETQEDGESAQEEPQEPEASENPEADSAGDKIRISRSKSRMISHRPDKRKNLLKRKRQRMIQQYRKINRRKMRTQHLWCRML